MPADLNKKIGTPDLLVLFTNTVSHKMVKCAMEEAKRNEIPVVRCHTSSKAALTDILEKQCVVKEKRGSVPFLNRVSHES